MPAIAPFYNPNDKAVNKQGDDERVARQKYITDRWNYYDGNQFRWLKKDPDALREDNITINLCGRSVDKAVEFIGTPDEFKVEGAKTEQPASVEVANLDGDARDLALKEALDITWEEYQQDAPEIVQSNFISGHSFVKLYFDSGNQPSMILLDPMYMSVFWNMMNARQLLFYRMQWKRGDDVYMQDIVPDWMLMGIDANTLPLAENWVIIDYKQGRGNLEWSTVKQEVWPYPFPPIVDWAFKRRPHQYYGVSFLHNSVELNDAVNFVTSNAARMIKHDAHRKAFAFGFEVSDENAVGGIWDGLPTDGRVEFSPTDDTLASSMNMLTLLKAEFFANQRILDLSTVKDRLGQISNFGVRMLFSDQLEMASEARATIGKGLAELMRRLLIMGGAAVEKKIEPEWPDMLPQNRLELLQAAKIESELGTTSITTLTESIDRDPEKEKELKATEAQSASSALVNTLTTFGERGLFGAGNNGAGAGTQAFGNGSANRLPLAS
jgi:hypothetical protein